MGYLVITGFIATGVFIGWRGIKSWIQFEDFCRRLAALRGEEAEIDRDCGKDESIGPYRDKVRRALANPSDDALIPQELKAEAAKLGEHMVAMFRLWVVYLLALGAVVLFALP